jgi:hypothetical protein
MKTIRPNCFETNSSSTHSLTLHAPTAVGRPVTTFLPNDEGVIEIQLDESPSELESCLTDKLSFLLSYAYASGDQAKFDNVRSVVEKFTGIPVKTVIQKREKTEWVTAEVTEVPAENSAEDLEDFAGMFTGDYGNGPLEDFVSVAEEIFASDDMILTFVFSNHYGFSSETYYDG